MLRVSVMPFVIGAVGTVSKGLKKRMAELEIGGKIETLRTMVLLRLARILRRVLETGGDFTVIKSFVKSQ